MKVYVTGINGENPPEDMSLKQQLKLIAYRYSLGADLSNDGAAPALTEYVTYPLSQAAAAIQRFESFMKIRGLLPLPLPEVTISDNPRSSVRILKTTEGSKNNWQLLVTQTDRERRVHVTQLGWIRDENYVPTRPAAFYIDDWSKDEARWIPRSTEEDFASIQYVADTINATVNALTKNYPSATRRLLRL